MANNNNVKVYGVWASPFSKRVEIALQLKGVEYEYIEEDLQNKSEELVKYNPVHKKIPVLVNNGKPIAESLVILEYIDETWKENPILPTDPYERAQARFWTRFIDEKILTTVQQALLIQGEETQKATEELHELLTILDNHIKEKEFHGKDTLGYVDIVGLVVVYWVPLIQEVSGKDVLTREKFPAIFNWAERLLSKTIIKENSPAKEKLLSLLSTLYVPAPSVAPN